MQIGFDLVEINRMNSLLEKPKFLYKLFNQEEISYISNKKYKGQSLAGLYAAKEAIFKAIGLGLSAMPFKDVTIMHDKKGTPYPIFNENGEKRLKDLGFTSVSISISHDGEIAASSAIAFETKDDIKQKSVQLNSFNLNDINFKLHNRLADSHKGNYGKVAIIGGSVGMAGSICLSCQAALRSGAGLVYAVVPRSISQIVQIKMTEVIVKEIEDEGHGHFLEKYYDKVLEAISSCNAVAIGPGIGRNKGMDQWLERLVENINIPLVLDADALFAASINSDILEKNKSEIFITPHQMEMKRLTGFSIDYISKNRNKVASEFAKDKGIGVILKGAGTVIAYGEDIHINPTGNPGMATAGSGDVLTGILIGLIARGYKPSEAARLSCYIHGLSGDIGARELGEESLIASDLISYLPRSFKMLEDFIKREGGNFA